MDTSIFPNILKNSDIKKYQKLLLLKLSDIYDIFSVMI